METRHVIQDLRKRLQLSQDDFAAKLFITRQAVSRWETGETIPSTDMLKQIAETFAVSIDALLGVSPRQCQSCGMTLYSDTVKGSNFDGSLSEEYCSYCFRNGSYTQDITMEEMAEHNLQDLDAWNLEMGLNLSKEQARPQLLDFLHTLERWKPMEQSRV